MLRLLRAKLHRARVTDARLDYVGSITIDATLLEAAGLLPLEEVDVVNVTTGGRWSTYVLPGPPGGGAVCPNGGGARLCAPGDVLVIFSYAHVPPAALGGEGHTARVIVLDEANRVIQRRTQSVRADGGAWAWTDDVDAPAAGAPPSDAAPTGLRGGWP
jgi:aspartate 1-decarboxylase